VLTGLRSGVMLVVGWPGGGPRVAGQVAEREGGVDDRASVKEVAAVVCVSRRWRP
jgi:hypothetical protein